MATKNHVDSSVAERRLRPIYNWLDDGNNKKALQEAEKVLKKQPNFQCAKVLKALALLRLGKESDTKLLLESVRKDLHFDDSTLQAMSICYREMNKLDEICAIYSFATKQDPKNEELLTHLFMAYVRVRDYKKQQQTAMTLYKLKLKNHYYFWAVMSIIMQAHDAGPELAKSLQLPLAEKMVKKFVDDKKVDAEQEVQLYLLILELQHKSEEALAVIDGPLQELLQSQFVVVLKVTLLVNMKCWEQTYEYVKKLLLDDMDNWSLYQNLFKSVFQIFNSLKSENTNGESGINTIDDCVTLLVEIQKKNKNTAHCLRGPYLAVMECFVQLEDNGIDPEMHGINDNYTDLLTNYFKIFGSKTCCLNDLSMYLDRLNDTQVNTFLDEIWKFVGLEDGQLPTSKEQMLRYISNLQISRYLGYHQKLSVKDKIRLFDCLFKYYVHGKQFSESSSVHLSDIKHNDPFIAMIVDILNDIWLETNDANYIKTAIAVLEHAVIKSPSYQQFKMLLIKMYNTLGATKGSQTAYELLDVKHVQLDSLGYLQSWALISTGQFFLASHSFDMTLKFFTSSYKDSADNLTYLYKSGSFLKINEFIQFREKVNNSLHYSAVTVEKMLLEILILSSNFQNSTKLVELSGIRPEKENIAFEKLEDNRDLDLFMTSDPKCRRMTEELGKLSFNHELDLLRVRSLTLRILAAAVQISNPSANTSVVNGNSAKSDAGQETKGTCTTLKNLTQQLIDLSESIKQKNYSRLPKNIINAPPESRLFHLIELPYISMVSDFASTLLTFSDNKDLANIENFSKENPLVKLNEAISLLSTECKSSDLSQINLHCTFLNKLTLLVEMGSIACFFCAVFVEIVKPLVNHIVKKGKKKKDSNLVHLIKEGVKDNELIILNKVEKLISLTVSTLEELDGCVSYIDETIHEEECSECDLEDSMSRLSLSEMELHNNSSASSIISSSYKSSLAEIRFVIRVKIKFLSELKL